MINSEERIKILEMIQDEKLSVEDGAKLLAALGGRPPGRTTPEQRWETSRLFRVLVSDQETGKTKVNVSLPLSLIDVGLNFASNFTSSAEGIPMDQIREMFQNGMTGKIIDVLDEESREHIEIFIN